MEQNAFSNFGRGSPKEPSCKIISKLMHWLRRRSHLKVFLYLALAAILFNEAETGFIQKGKNKIPRHFPDTNSNFPDENDPQNIFSPKLLFSMRQ